MFIEVLRRYLEDLPPGQTGWLAGLRDEVVGRVLALLHAPARPSVDAGRAGAARPPRPAPTWPSGSRELVGQPPMQYLAQWRMQVAANLLAQSCTKVAAIGAEVGYDSEAAFSRAFKKATGLAPGAWRVARRTARTYPPSARADLEQPAGLPAEHRRYAGAGSRDGQSLAESPRPAQTDCHARTRRAPPTAGGVAWHPKRSLRRRPRHPRRGPRLVRGPAHRAGPGDLDGGRFPPDRPQLRARRRGVHRAARAPSGRVGARRRVRHRQPRDPGGAGRRAGHGHRHRRQPDRAGASSRPRPPASASPSRSVTPRRCRISTASSTPP